MTSNSWCERSKLGLLLVNVVALLSISLASDVAFLEKRQALPPEVEPQKATTALLGIPSKLIQFFVSLSSIGVPFPKHLVIPESVHENIPEGLREASGNVNHISEKSKGPLKPNLLDWVMENPENLAKLCENVEIQRELEVNALGVVCVILDLVSDGTFGNSLEDRVPGSASLDQGSAKTSPSLRGSLASRKNMTALELIKMLQVETKHQPPEHEMSLEQRLYLQRLQMPSSEQKKTILPDRLSEVRHSEQSLLGELSKMNSSIEKLRSRRLTAVSTLSDSSSSMEKLPSEVARGIQAIAQSIGPINSSLSLFPENFSYGLATKVPVLFRRYVYDANETTEDRSNSDPPSEEDQRRLDDALLERLMRLEALNRALEILIGKQPFVPNEEETDLLQYMVDILKNQNISFAHLKGQPPRFPTAAQLAVEGIDINNEHIVKEEGPWDRLEAQKKQILQKLSRNWNEDPNDGFFVFLFPMLHPLNALEINAEDMLFDRIVDVVFDSTLALGDVAERTGIDELMTSPLSPTIIFNRVLPFFMETLRMAAPMVPFGGSVAAVAQSELGTSDLPAWAYTPHGKTQSGPKLSVNLPMDFNSRTEDGRYVPPLDWELPDRIAVSNRGPMSTSAISAMRNGFGILIHLIYDRPLTSIDKFVPVTNALDRVKHEFRTIPEVMFAPKSRKSAFIQSTRHI